MKLSRRKIFRRLLLATLAATSLTCWNISYAQDVTPDTSSDNEVEARDTNYSINGNRNSVSEDYRYVYGGGNESSNTAARNNRVRIYSGNFTSIFGGVATASNVWNNYVAINGGTISGAVGGLGVYYSGGSFGNVYGNTVEVFGGSVRYVSGGELAYGYLVDGTTSVDYSSALGNVYNNRVLIRGGSISGGVIGGSALGGSAYGNAIEISGGTVSGDVVGGLTRSGSAYGNTITISGNPDLSGATLWGGRIGSNTATSSGNTLNINTWGVTAQNIYGFETINFDLPYQGSGNILTLTGSSTNLDGLARVGFAARADSGIGTGSTLPLIYNANGLTLNNSGLLASSADEANYSTVMNSGVSFNYALNLQLSPDGTSLIGTVGENLGPKDDNPTSNSSLVNVETVNEGTDNVITSMNDYLSNQTSEDDNGYFVDRPESLPVITGFEVFGNIGAGSMRTRTQGGGHIKNRAINFDLGLARTYERGGNRWVVAPVIEYGKGKYDAYLSSSVKGSGDTHYTAGGLIGRRMNDAGYYIELSARAGRSENDFASDDFRITNADGSTQFVRATYNTSATVFAGHVRLGQARRLNRSNLLDVYGIFAYSHQGGDNATLSVGDAYRFSSVASSRFRLGYRLTTRTSRISRIYTGLAYQYEHTTDSLTEVRDAEGRYWGLPHSGSRGSSVMLELGWMIKPRKDNPWLLDISATGWLGHQRGVTATANLKKSF